MKKFLAFLAGMILGISSPSPSSVRAEGCSLFAFNVGKADCLLLRAGENVWLIDTGRGRTFDEVEAVLSAMSVASLDGVIITHMDSDHVGGLKKLLKSDIEVNHIYIPPFFLPEKDNEENPALKATGKNSKNVGYLHAGDILPLGSGSLRVLGPLRAAKDKEDNNSLVLLADTPDGTILLTGDMEFPEEQDLLSAGVIPKADVLKVPNHGDDDATSEALLSAVQPKAAVISTSTEEKASTPAKRVLRLLEKWNADILQTQDAQTGILLTLKNGNLSVEYR